MIPPKSLKTLLYVFSRKKEDPDVLPLSPLFSTAGRKSKVKSQKSKRRQYRLFNDLEWLVYLCRVVLLKTQQGLETSTGSAAW
jgi:hypothetical protein